jgi:hypothetical protein
VFGACDSITRAKVEGWDLCFQERQAKPLKVVSPSGLSRIKNFKPGGNKKGGRLQFITFSTVEIMVFRWN